MKNDSEKAPKAAKARSNGLKKRASKTLRPLALAILLVLVLGGAVGVGIAAMSQESIENFLPAEQTVGFLEFETGFLPKHLKIGAGEQSILPALQVLTNLPLNQLPSSWWNHPFGLVLVQQEDGSNAWALFAQGASRRALAGDLKQVTSLNLSEPLYTHSQGLNFSFGFSDHYAFLSSSQEAIETLKSVQEAALEKEPAFQSMQAELPGRAWVKGYMQTAQVNLPDFPTAHYAMSSMSHAAPAGMMTIQEKSGGLEVKALMHLAEFAQEKRGEIQDSATEQMANYIPKESVALFFTGPNLTQQWQKTLTDLSHMNPAYGVILESLARAQVQELFGGNVDLRNDLYPLLEGRYATVLGQEEDGFAIGMAVEHDDAGFVEVKLNKLLNGFHALVGQLNPQVKVVTLPDGTESRELVASSQNAEEVQEEYEGLTLTCLSAEVSSSSTLKGELLRSFCYTATPEVFYMATSNTLLKKMIDAHQNGSSLTNLATFKKGLSQVSWNNEMMTYVDMEYLAPLIAKRAPRQPVEKAEENIEEAQESAQATEENPENTTESEDAEESTPSTESAKSQPDQQGALLSTFLSQLGQSTWVKEATNEGVKFEGFVMVE